MYNIGAKVIGYSLPPVNENDHFNLLNLEKKITHIDGNILNENDVNEVFLSYKLFGR